MKQLDPLSKRLLADILADFVTQGLGAATLRSGYTGVSLSLLAQMHVGAGDTTQVGFDLAVKEIEGAKLAKTGPMVAYPNRPGSGVLMLGAYSKREYIRLTEDGYRAAQRNKTPPTPAVRAAVHITGGRSTTRR